MGPLRPGKLPIDLLDKTVLRLTGAPSTRIGTSPKAGVDFAAVKTDEGYLIISADPVTGVKEQIGRYAVSISANDVATSGNRPQFIESVILLPERSDTADLETIAKEIDHSAKELGIAIVGGHTEVTPGLERPIVVSTAFAFGNEYVSSADARPGDSLMMTKTAGIEGTAVIASLGIKAAVTSPSLSGKASRFVERLSVVAEATKAYRTRSVHAMHDCTEGGVLGAAFEMSLASGLGFTLYERAVPVASQTREICTKLSLDPLKLIASGSLLLSVTPGDEERVKEALKGISVVNKVGEFTKGKRILLGKDGREEELKGAPEDELWRLVGRLL